MRNIHPVGFICPLCQSPGWPTGTKFSLKFGVFWPGWVRCICGWLCWGLPNRCMHHPVPSISSWQCDQSSSNEQRGLCCLHESNLTMSPQAATCWPCRPLSLIMPPPLLQLFKTWHLPRRFHNRLPVLVHKGRWLVFGTHACCQSAAHCSPRTQCACTKLVHCRAGRASCLLCIQLSQKQQ